MRWFINWYGKTYKIWPYSLAFATCYFKGTIADAFAQTQLEKRTTASDKSNIMLNTTAELETLGNYNSELTIVNTSLNVGTNNNLNLVPKRCNNNLNFDISRNWRFALWSGLYCGSFQHYLYNIFYPRFIPGTCAKRTLIRSLCDNFIHGPLVSTPIYFAFKGFLLYGSCIKGLHNYWIEKWDIMIPYWKFWIPSMFIIMYLLPFEFRILGIGCASLFWMIIFSWLSPMQDNSAGYSSINTHTNMDIDQHVDYYNTDGNQEKPQI